MNRNSRSKQEKRSPRLALLVTQPRYPEGLQPLGNGRGTAGRAKAAMESGFNYSHAVTVTSGQDAEAQTEA